MGEATAHLARCGRGGGGILAIRQAVVLLMLPGSRNCEWGALFLNRTGEEDRHMKRGQVLFVSRERCEQLRQLVIRNGYAHDTRTLTGLLRYLVF